MDTLEIQEMEGLIDRTLTGSALPAEMKLVDDWYAQFEHLPGLPEVELAERLPFQLERLREKIIPKGPRFCLVIV
jgi:hypothetical protein